MANVRRIRLVRAGRPRKRRQAEVVAGAGRRARSSQAAAGRRSIWPATQPRGAEAETLHRFGRPTNKASGKRAGGRVGANYESARRGSSGGRRRANERPSETGAQKLGAHSLAPIGATRGGRGDFGAPQARRRDLIKSEPFGTRAGPPRELAAAQQLGGLVHARAVEIDFRPRFARPEQLSRRALRPKLASSARGDLPPFAPVPRPA